MSRILIRRGNKAELPALNVGEMGFATDTKELFVGSSGGNTQAVTQLSGGSKIQSGTVAFTPTTTGFQKLGSVTFPTAFNQAPLMLVGASVNAGAVNNLQGSDATTTKFDLYANVTAANSTVYFVWLAIGS